MADSSLPSQEALKAAFSYDAETGILRWKISPSSNVSIGQEVGTNHKSGGKYTGYRLVRFHGKQYLLHRIIWALEVGSIPDGLEIDHIDRDRTNNKISNLRLVSHADNMRNSSGTKGKLLSKPPITSKTKQLYIHFCNNRKKYIVTFPRLKIIGRFNTLNEAIVCRDNAVDMHIKGA